MTDGTDKEGAAPGWDAIDQAMKRLYGDQEPVHKAPVLHASLGGDFFLWGVSAYRAGGDGVAPHWHFVTFGMTELYEKEWEEKEVSGWGFEFTFRFSRHGPNENEPPIWAFTFLGNLARYVYRSGNSFGPGHYMDLRGPIALEHETDICAAMFIEDPLLPQIESPNGKLGFLQVVGTTMDELTAAQAWDTQKFLQEMKRIEPLLITDLARASILRNETVAAEVAEGTRRDGSSSGALYVETAEGRCCDGGGLELVFGASAVGTLASLLRGRLVFERDFMARSAKRFVAFEAGSVLSWRNEGEGLVLILPPALVEPLCAALIPKRGTYPVAGVPEIRVRIVPSEIKDQAGKVTRVIG